MFDFEQYGEKAKRSVMDLQNCAQEKDAKIQALMQERLSHESLIKELKSRIMILEDEIREIRMHEVKK